MDDRCEAFGTSHSLMCRTGIAATAVALLFTAACGSPQESPRSPRSDHEPAAESATEPATVAGVAAAVLTHLDPDSVQGTGGNRNDDEKWMAVSLEVELEETNAVVPLNVMVTEYSAEAERPSPGDMCRDVPRHLCHTWMEGDGSFVVLTTSTEGPTGGIDPEGLVAYAVHFRQDSYVMVSEDMPSREPHYADMSSLPLDVSLLEEIATDPNVGTHTTPELNEAGKDLRGVFSSAPG